MQPGHEYTKGNVKFCLAVSQTEPIKKLEAFANANQQTQGKFTIGDEKVRLYQGQRWNLANDVSSFTMSSCELRYVILCCSILRTTLTRTGPRNPKENRQDRPHRCHGRSPRDEELNVNSLRYNKAIYSNYKHKKMNPESRMKKSQLNYIHYTKMKIDLSPVLPPSLPFP